MVRKQFEMDFISRQQLTSDELPPWAGIVFKYPVDSDDLSEKLRAAYPDCKTHRERKHQAAIDFLYAELLRMQSGSSSTDPNSPSNLKNVPQEPTPAASRLLTEVLSEGSEALSASGRTPSSLIESTLSPTLAERIRKTSQATVDSEQSQAKASPTAAQQFVWSARDGRSMHPKTKRKMTVEERNAYKNTRKRGACDKCRRQKGRCTHFNDDDDSWQISVDSKRRYVASLLILMCLLKRALSRSRWSILPMSITCHRADQLLRTSEHCPRGRYRCISMSGLSLTKHMMNNE
ncbi:hypothetical protein PMIN04_005749 [Paraphaeosphaeria minitans]